MTFQFRIQLKDVSKPPVWRQIQVPATFTFDQFHAVIQQCFGWDNFHLYQFSPQGHGSYPVIAIPSKEDWEKPDMNAMKARLKKVFKYEKETFSYIYDFGDDWYHKITLEKILPGEIESAVCLAGKGACPPEDCGGPWGYENLKIIQANPKQEGNKERKEWLGLNKDEDWDVNSFDLEMANRLLKFINNQPE
jgi:hypothetical protein